MNLFVVGLLLSFLPSSQPTHAACLVSPRPTLPLAELAELCVGAKVSGATVISTGTCHLAVSEAGDRLDFILAAISESVRFLYQASITASERFCIRG